MKATFKNIFILSILALVPEFANAAAMGMGMGMGPPCGPPFPPCPIPLDSSVIWLLAAGAAFGGWKIYTYFKKNPA
jgi:hypothetical protein